MVTHTNDVAAKEGCQVQDILSILHSISFLHVERHHLTCLGSLM